MTSDLVFAVTVRDMSLLDEAEFALVWNALAIVVQARIREAKLRTRERSCLPSPKEPRHD